MSCTAQEFRWNMTFEVDIFLLVFLRHSFYHSMVIEKLGNSGNLEMWFSGLEKYTECVFLCVIFVFSQKKSTN